MDKEINLNTKVTLEEVLEAEASVFQNRDYTYRVKFTFTDAGVNANKQRVPKSEFPNIIKTGVGMPIKLASLDNMVHKNSDPIGTITHLRENEDTIEGLGVLWKAEREEEVAAIKLLKEAGAEVNLSWELGYRDSSVDEEGVETLLDVVVKATTIVSDPAYKGRTQITALAEVDYKKLYEELLLKYEALCKEKEEEDMEMASLKTYKDEEEKKKEKKKKLDSLKEKYKKAGIEKDDEYFEINSEKLLSMSEEDLDFHLNEMISFAQASVSKVKIPNLTQTKNPVSIKEIADGFKELYKR